MAKKKKERKPKSDKELSLLEPVDIMQLGSELDCFGKEYDLSTDECKRCGDSEFCAIACSANLHAERKKIGKKTVFKDEQLDKNEDSKIKDFITKKLERGVEESKIVVRVVKRFGISKKDAKKMVEKYAQD